jgi:uncharacterized protein
MAPTPSTFVWYELMTDDVAGSARFYAAVLGWAITDAGMPSRIYLLAATAGIRHAGLMPIPDEARARGARPGWLGYVGVADVDGTVIELVSRGGVLKRHPENIPAVGRFAVVGDADGAPFVVFSPLSPEVTGTPAPDAPGRVGWHELQAGDGDRAFAFYAELFGWTTAGDVDVGEHGPYHLFRATGEPLGGIMTRLPTVSHPHWLFYFTVDGIDAALARVAGAGGRLVIGPHQVPGGQWIAHCEDTGGAAFSLMSTAR